MKERMIVRSEGITAGHCMADLDEVELLCVSTLCSGVTQTQSCTQLFFVCVCPLVSEATEPENQKGGWG